MLVETILCRPLTLTLQCLGGTHMLIFLYLVILGYISMTAFGTVVHAPICKFPWHIIFFFYQRAEVPFGITKWESVEDRTSSVKVGRGIEKYIYT